MVVPAKVMFGITLEGVPKEVIIAKLEILQYTVPLKTKTLGEKDIDQNYIMCESVFVDVTTIGGYMSMLYDLHNGIKRVIPLHIELLEIPGQVTTGTERMNECSKSPHDCNSIIFCVVCRSNSGKALVGHSLN